MNNAEEYLWQIIEIEMAKYNDLRLGDMLDYTRYYLYSIITHSTAIEGSLLTELDTQLLFDDGLTAKGKPLTHHLMNEDLKNAYLFASRRAEEKSPISVDLLRELNAHVMKSTGGMVNVMGGSFDSSKGEFRLCNVTAGYGGTAYLNYMKIPEKINEFVCGMEEMEKRLNSELCLQNKYNLSFDVHLRLVNIHPWVDGNGRTARLLMNYIQFYHRIFPVKVYHEDKLEYIRALVEFRNTGTANAFRLFMAEQLLKTLKEEITRYGGQ
jgi:Fic family protein